LDPDKISDKVIRSPSPAPPAQLTAGKFLYDLWVSLCDLKDDLATYTPSEREEKPDYTWTCLDNRSACWSRHVYTIGA
jgi:hypothetical protein